MYNRFYQILDKDVNKIMAYIYIWPGGVSEKMQGVHSTDGTYHILIHEEFPVPQV